MRFEFVLASIILAGICLPAVFTQECDFTGTWEGEGAFGNMVLQQSGDKVTGNYTPEDGRIQAAVQDKKLIGTWSRAPSYSPPNDAGDLELAMSDNCNSLTGKWRYGSSSKWLEGWNGTRKSSSSDGSALTQASTTFASYEEVQDPVEWPKTVDGNGHFYEAVLVPNGITWDGANAEAEAKGGHLVTITDKAENDFVYALVSNDKFWYKDPREGHGVGPWIGGYRPSGSSEQAVDLTWVTEEPFSYANWVPGGPAKFEAEGAIMFMGYALPKAPTWAVNPQDLKSHGYIIEWEPVEEDQSNKNVVTYEKVCETRAL